MENKLVQNKRRVAVTGIGAVTPLGINFQNSWSGILEGVSMGSHVKRFDASQYPSNIAYEVTDFKIDAAAFSKSELFYMNPAAQYGLGAALEALEQSGVLNANYDPYRRRVCIGVGMGVNELPWYNEVVLPEQYDSPQIKKLLRCWPSTIGPIAARLLHASGGYTIVHTACASSGQSVGEAYEQIAYGHADVVLTGGTDSMIEPTYFAGFSLLGALSTRNNDPKTASRPFDLDRNGFVLGEGACMMVLEEYAAAKARGAKILGEIAGYGVTESAYRITDLHPEGAGPLEAMTMAVNDAGIVPTQVGYINAHGTSTQLNDRIEALAISKAFVNTNLQVSSTKSMTGHLISAAGALELAFCMKALEQQILPPSVNLFNPDPAVLVKLTASKAQPTSMEYALSNSVGFGGSNTAIVARRVSHA